MHRTRHFVVSIFFIFALVLELSVNSTGAFVRVAANNSCSSSHADPSDHATPEATPITEQCDPASHCAAPASAFVFKPALEGRNFSRIAWLIPCDPEAFVILRPPIA